MKTVLVFSLFLAGGLIAQEYEDPNLVVEPQVSDAQVLLASQSIPCEKHSKDKKGCEKNLMFDNKNFKLSEEVTGKRGGRSFASINDILDQPKFYSNNFLVYPQDLLFSELGEERKEILNHDNPDPVEKKVQNISAFFSSKKEKEMLLAGKIKIVSDKPLEGQSKKDCIERSIKFKYSYLKKIYVKFICLD